jgi:hypothetical protein
VIEKIDIRPGIFGLIGASCFLIASSYVPKNKIISVDFFSILPLMRDTIVTLRQIIVYILTTINFDLMMSCAIDYIDLYKSYYSVQVIELATLISFLFTGLDKKDRINPKLQGFACIMLACMHYGEKINHINIIKDEQLKFINNIPSIAYKDMPNIVAYLSKKLDLSPETFISETMKKPIIV